MRKTYPRIITNKGPILSFPSVYDDEEYYHIVDYKQKIKLFFNTSLI